MDPRSQPRGQPSQSRRRFLSLAATGLLAGAGCLGDAGTTTTDPDGTETTTAGTGTTDTVSAVGLDPVVTGFDAPVDVAFAPDADRRYVVDQSGVVAVHDRSRRKRPFLDLRGRIEVGGEKGLLGLALHPEFADNRRAYVRYSASPRPGTPSGYSHTFVLAEFTATDDGTRLDPDSERTLLEIPEPQSNHNAGSLAFGPDGFLYVGIGDGGGGGDQGSGHVEDWYDAVPGGNGQDVTENLLGSVLRIDVDGRRAGTPYAVPDDNPLVGREGLDEHFAWGFRNPWRFSFDGPDLLVGDVGQNRYEEVDRVEKGGNYGWNVREGTHCFGADDCPDATPDDVRGGEPLVDPVVEYPHSGDGVSGISVIGGYVYRGSTLPGLAGTYVFGDLRSNGRLFAAEPTDGGRWPTRTLELAGGPDLAGVLSFGRDAEGEVYVLGRKRNGGGLYRLVGAND
ncbi:MAG: sorbosone dehydrogenase family protein [Haloarculaceae archaeon]